MFFKLIISLMGILLVTSCSTAQKNSNLIEMNQSRVPAEDTTADIISEKTPIAKLENCGGHDGIAKMVRKSDGNLYITAKNMDCSWWTTKKLNYVPQKMNGLAHNFWIEIRVDETIVGEHEFIVGSKNFIAAYDDSKSTEKVAKKTDFKGDVVRYYIPAKSKTLNLTNDDSKITSLESCGGKIRAHITDNNNLMINLRNIERCNTFDILDNDGKKVDYDEVKLDFSDNDDGREKDIRIPQKLMELGYNSITIRIYKKGGHNEDRFDIDFTALPKNLFYLRR